MDRARRDLLHRSDLVPALPDLVARLLVLLNDPCTEPKDLETLLQHDPALVGRMLALVNSPYYGLNRTVRTIREAIVVLGFRGVRGLVLATSAAKMMQRDFSCYGHGHKGLWLHSACVAAGARLLARQAALGEEVAEQLFVAGLLHDVGKLVLLPYVFEFKQLATAADLTAQERTLVGIDHAEAGALAAAKWSLPSDLQAVIRRHHEPSAGAADAPSALVRLADCAAHELGTGYAAGMAPKSAPQGLDLAVAGLTDATWLQLRDQLVLVMDEAARALSLLSSERQ